MITAHVTDFFGAATDLEVAEVHSVDVSPRAAGVITPIRRLANKIIQIGISEILNMDLPKVRVDRARRKGDGYDGYREDLDLLHEHLFLSSIELFR